MQKTFLKYEKPLLTAMVLGDNPDRIKELMDKSLKEGAEAFGIQFESVQPQFRNAQTYRELFTYTDKPMYVTNYRGGKNKDKTDDEISVELLELAGCGATLCDVMGDLFDKQPDEVAVKGEAIEKQMKLIDKLHKKGAEVLISSHILKYTSPERILEIALEHERRGADISKIVTGADTVDDELDNLKTAHLLKKNLKIPFLFLSNGECHLLRRISGNLGACMCLCVQEHDNFSTKEQPLLKNMKAIRDNM